MDDEQYNVINEGTRNLTFTPWYEHAFTFLTSQWKTIVVYFFGIFGVFWGVIEASSFFYSELELSSVLVFFIVITISTISAFLRCIYLYRNALVKGLESESFEINRIAFSKKQFWEFALAYELIKSRIELIDRNFDDVINNRVHVKVTKSLDHEQYLFWLQTRPDNLLRLTAVTKQLLITDLIEALDTPESGDFNFHNLLRVVDLIKDVYQSAHDFEIEGHEIRIPEGFEAVHDMQIGWTVTIRDGFHQMLDILQALSLRDKGDFSPMKQTIVLEEPPRMNEFEVELKRVCKRLGLN